jgi:CDP-diacylglycerol--glycerol-3-phosphate 3-phosphatidyltransferase
MERNGKRCHYYLVNSITLYRLIVAPVIALLVFFEQYEAFSWLITLSFCTDAIDGFLARWLKVTSQFGARIDSVADDLTIAAAVYGVIVFKHDFFADKMAIILIMIALFVFQYAASLVRYGKLSSFHTYLAKLAMLFQGCFIILLFFLPDAPMWLFYLATVATILDLSEEILLVFMLPKWRANVKGIYWVVTNKI